MNPQELQEFFAQLPPQIQEKVSKLPKEQQMQVVAQLYEKYMSQAQQGNPQGQQQAPQEEMYEQAPMGKYGYRANYGYMAEEGYSNDSSKVPVEAERNETLTVKQGTTPYTEGGVLEKKSSNPISGETTYEIPDDRYNKSHGEGGVNMMLEGGDVINSDKTKIPFDFKIGSSNFKNKTFKKAADAIASLEKKAEKKFKHLEEINQVDDITTQTYALMFAKYAKHRQELNDAQETLLELKKQTDVNENTNEAIARYGKVLTSVEKAEKGLNVAMDSFMSNKRGYTNPEKVLKANDGLTARVKGMQQLLSDTREQGLDVQGITGRAKELGLLDNYSSVETKSSKPKSLIQPFTYNPSSDTLQQFKTVIAQKESVNYNNPYIAVGGLTETQAQQPYEKIKDKAASSALGKYQFLWNTWKNSIKKQTGIEDPDEFRNNPAAQEQFMDWYTKNELMPTASRLKQQYQIKDNIYEIMAALHLEGEKNYIKKFKAGQLGTSTMAGKFKNLDTESYKSAFSQFPDEQPEEAMKYGGSVYGIGQDIPRYTAQENFTLAEDTTGYLPKSKRYAQTGANISNANPFTIWAGDKSGANVGKYKADQLQYINNMYFNGEHKDNASLQAAMYDYMLAQGKPVQSTYQGKINPNATREEILNKGLFGDDWADSVNYMTENAFDPSSRSNPNPLSPSNIQLAPGKPIVPRTYDYASDDELQTDTSITPTVNTPEGVGFTKPESTWWQKANYAVDQMLPAANALSLMMEKPITPTLQRKRARYTDMRTDVDVNPQMNEMQRMYLTQSADERGNPSVRNARLAQVSSNILNQENQVLANKYNTENQLFNANVARRDGYYNQLDDINRGLAKTYEQETLQTAENVRQQRRMASDYLMNLKLRKQEEQKATKLALSNTIYDYDPISGELYKNPTKAGELLAQKQYEIQLQNILLQMQKAQEDLRLAKTDTEKESLETQIANLTSTVNTLKSDAIAPQKKNYGGKIRSKAQEAKEKKFFPTALNPESNYVNLFPNY